MLYDQQHRLMFASKPAYTAGLLTAVTFERMQAARSLLLNSRPCASAPILHKVNVGRSVALRCNARVLSRTAPLAAHAASTEPATVCKTDYTIRPAVAEDVPKLVVIEQACSEFSAGWGESEIRGELSKNFSRVLVAADANSDHALGYIVGWLIAGELQILELAVDPEQQSQGVGSALLGALLQQCGCDDAAEAMLEVKEGNHKAVKLYEKYNFTIVGSRQKYYADGSAALLMARKPST